MQDYKTIRTIKELGAYIGGSDVIAFDFECSPSAQYRSEPKAALDPHKSDITGVSVSNKAGTGRYIPLRHRVGLNADLKEMMDYLTTKIFLSPKATKVAHNISYESMYLYKGGVVLQPPVYDTIAAAQLTLKSAHNFRELTDSGLKTLVPELFGEQLPSFSDVTEGKFFDELDPDNWETCRYACADSDYALQLREQLNGWFDEYLPKHRYVCEEIESPTAVYAGVMKYNGVQLDAQQMREKQSEANAKMEELREKIAFIIGDVELGANASTQAFKKYLYDSLKLPVLKITKKSKEAADDETMQLLAEYCKRSRPELTQLFALVQEYRKWGKIKSTYIDSYLNFVTAESRIHPEFMPLATDTGRFACRKPNIQNLPQGGNDPIGVRNFILARKGYKLIEADYSQVELRIAAYLSQDETMLGAYAKGEDIHAITTSALFKIAIDEAKDKHNSEFKKRRTVAKTTIFGVLYGIYKKSLQRNLKIDAGLEFTETECGEYIGSIKHRYKRLAAWQYEITKCARVDGYVETRLGRRRYLYGINSLDFGVRSTRERMALNTPVQGLAADCLKLAMAQLTTQLQGKEYIKPIMTVHDSLVFEVDEERVEEAEAIIKSCMERKPPIDDFCITLVAEVGVGNRYGELD